MPLLMPNIDLAQLVAQAVARGWAAGTGSLHNIESYAARNRWQIVPSRRRGPAIDVLVPTKPSDARPASLSATYGRGAQPLHTDGAHHTVPPDIVLLAADAASDVPTLLWRFNPGTLADEVEDAAQEGLFTVRSSGEAFLAAAWNGRRLRFDPGCMEAGDERASRISQFFNSAAATADRFEWATAGQVLAIDNRRVLHARGSAEDEPDRVLQRVAIRLPEEHQ